MRLSPHEPRPASRRMRYRHPSSVNERNHHEEQDSGNPGRFGRRCGRGGDRGNVRVRRECRADRERRRVAPGQAGTGRGVRAGAWRQCRCRRVRLVRRHGTHVPRQEPSADRLQRVAAHRARSACQRCAVPRRVLDRPGRPDAGTGSAHLDHQQHATQASPARAPTWPTCSTSAASPTGTRTRPNCGTPGSSGRPSPVRTSTAR